MTDEIERIKRIEGQTEAHYAAIGRFVVSFEHMSHAIVTAITSALIQSGLANRKLAEAAIAGLTADPLRKIFRAVVGEMRGDAMCEPERVLLRSLLKRIADLSEVRNEIVHSTWFVGWASPTDQDVSSSLRIKVKNNARAETDQQNYSVDDFKMQIAEAVELKDLILSVSWALSNGAALTSQLMVRHGKVCRI